MKIFLIGFMGCGKTTLAKKLASRLSYQLLDLDLEIEKRAGMPIGAYFAAHGENAFRLLESETLKTMDYMADAVIATGGGAPCHFDNMEWMNQQGLTIYMEMAPAALARRLEKGKAKRPLLKDLDQAGILHFIEQKLQERKPWYHQAQLIVSGVNLDAASMEKLIREKLSDPRSEIAPL